MWRVSRLKKATIFLTTITAHSTTISPSKHHNEDPVFSQPHQKAPVKPEKRFNGRL
jgi:hypothetical protein